jgi:DNA (cytosine-5)-methyltransferase 1
MLKKPRLLDLFCGAGGAAVGYHRAGFDVVGVDISPQPRYPFTFIQTDAIAYASAHAHEFDTIHASPPCQYHNSLSKLNGQKHGSSYLNLIPQTREVLRLSGRPYVIENVMGAKKHLINPIMLCGTYFGLKVYRHRLFECQPFILSPFWHYPHEDKSPGCSGDRTSPKGFITVCGGRGGGFKLQPASNAMGINWMQRTELAQAIPPAYTEWIGLQILSQLSQK